MKAIREAYLIADVLENVLSEMKGKNIEYYLCNYSQEELKEVINNARKFILDNE